MRKPLCFILALLAFDLTATAASTDVAANAINSLGIDLLRQTKPDQNTVLSPYSIQSAMAMAYEGADGTTRTEMAKVLHYPDDDKIRSALANLRSSLDEIATYSQAFTLTTAIRLFGQAGYDFRPAYQSLLKTSYAAPFEALDFRSNASQSAKYINDWVEKQTHNRIKDLISPAALNELTRLVLVNAIYLKAPWMEPFSPSKTKSQPFHLPDGKTIDAPTMVQRQEFTFGYAKFASFTAVTLPYSHGHLQFLILLPDSPTGLDELQSNVTPEMLAECSKLQTKEILIYLPKFKIHPSLFALKDNFEKLGMKKAFDSPIKSANFDKIAPRRGDDYLYISDILHKTFIDVDEKETEAAAATAMKFVTNGAHLEPDKPVEVRIDHPFLFAIQHRETGACLFLGRVTDPTAN